MTTIAYQGHHCRNCWNVALWIANDEGLYRAALDAKRRNPTSLQRAAIGFIEDTGFTRTPDGARCTIAAVKRAIDDLE